jgi:NitT/TauT family transport system ATP-binding protein
MGSMPQVKDTLRMAAGGLAAERREEPKRQPPFIQISGLKKTFATRSGEAVQALSDVDLDIAKNEFVSVVGPSGCGKTTLLRILAGLERASAGTVRFGGELVTGTRADVGVVFQQPTLLPWNTVLSNVMLPVQLKGDRSPEKVDRAKRLLSFVGLGDFTGKYPFELSGGMQQRVAICRALMREPRVLLMDEPFGALDAMTREFMNVEVMRLWSEERKTVVFITHSIPEAVLLGDRVLVMSPRPGRIAGVVDVDIGRPRSLQTMSAARFAELCGHIRGVLGSEAPAGASI